MVTNGHCIPSQQACESSSFVFDYALTNEADEWLDRVPTQNVYACDRIMAWDYTSNCDVDYAVVRLKRRVEDRDPLDVRPSTDELDAENLVIIGHPFGLPRKYALNGNLVASGSNTFTTIETVTIPIHARKIRIIMGATDGSRVHEAFINRLELAPGRPAEGFRPCVTNDECDQGYTCTDTGNGEPVCLQ